MKNIDDLSDDELYASYEAYKALLDAGLSKPQALERSGITAEIVKDFEEEEEADDLSSGYEDKWDTSSDEDDEIGGDSWKEEDLDDDFDDSDFDEDLGDEGGAGWDDTY